MKSHTDRPIRVTADYSTETERLELWKATMVNPEQLSVLIARKIKNSHNKNILKEVITTKPALQKLLEGILQIEKRNKSI